MTIKKTIVYTTFDGKTFMDYNEAQEHDQELKTQPKYIKTLPVEEKSALLKYSSYAIMITAADLMIDNVYTYPKGGVIGKTKLKESLNSESLTSGYYLNDTGKQIDNLLNTIGLSLYYDSDIEGRNTSLNVRVLTDEYRNNFDPNQKINEIAELLELN